MAGSRSTPPTVLPASKHLASFKYYFEKWGDVIDCVLMYEKETGNPALRPRLTSPLVGRSRGFGFVTMKDPSLVQVIIRESPHYLDGKQVTRLNLTLKRLTARRPCRRIRRQEPVSNVTQHSYQQARLHRPTRTFPLTAGAGPTTHLQNESSRR